MARNRGCANREQRLAPEGFLSWPEYWYSELEKGVTIKSLERPGYSTSDIRYFTREWAVKNDRVVLPLLMATKAAGRAA